MTLITTLVVRTEGRPAAAVPSIRDAVVQTDPDVTVLHAAALSDLVSGQFAGPRLNAVLLSLFGAGATLLAAVGLYSAARRSGQGASSGACDPSGNRRHACSPSAHGRCSRGLAVCGGLAFGLAGGLASGRLLGNVLYGVAPNDL